MTTSEHAIPSHSLLFKIINNLIRDQDMDNTMLEMNNLRRAKLSPYHFISYDEMILYIRKYVTSNQLTNIIKKHPELLEHFI